jgi:3-oxoacyl-(acyl-carrier-protein) synthase
MGIPRVVISGIGFVTSIGNDRRAVASSLRNLQSGIERFEFIPGVDLPVKVAGTIKGFNTEAPQWSTWRWPDGYTFPREALRGLPPHGLYALCACEQAIGDARLAPADLATDETALFCSSGGSPRLLRQYLNQIHDSRGARVPPLGVVSTISGTLNFNLAAFYGIRGAVVGFSSACASTTQAIGYGCDEIRLARHRRVLVVGGEELGLESTYTFQGMRALSRNPDPAGASRPFDRGRDGFVGTGGSVALILEEADSARARGAPIYAEMAGWGQAGEGFNPAVSDPDGRGLATAMRRALASAAVAPGEIDYVNAHATSTPVGDASEARALHTVFSAVGARPRISSTKALTGHGLSLAGVMETAFCAVCFAEGFVPGAAHLVDPDPACEGLDLPRTSQALAPRLMLKNSSGFGGSTVSLVLRRWEQ